MYKTRENSARIRAQVHALKGRLYDYKEIGQMVKGSNGKPIGKSMAWYYAKPLPDECPTCLRKLVEEKT